MRFVLRFLHIWISKGVFFSSYVLQTSRFYYKKRVAIRAHKLMTFGRLLIGASGGRRALSNSAGSTENDAKIHGHPAPPAGVRRILTLCRTPRSREEGCVVAAVLLS